MRFEAAPARPTPQPPPLPADEAWSPGDSIAGTQYRYVRELGRGVQGLAIEVEHAFLGSRAVMKILRAQHVSRRHVAERVRTEARALVELRHRNIARVTDGGMTAEDEPRPFFVMELLAGETLRARLKRAGALGVRHALDIAIDILDALDHAHARNMVHRDVKPANLFLAETRPTPRAILLDFGIASVIQPGQDQRAAFCGTFEYAAPEQLDGYLSPSVDVYALGIVLYASLLGRHPFAGTPREELPRVQRQVVPPALVSLRADVPVALSDLLARAMHKDPHERPKSAFAFAQKLRDLRARVHGEGGLQVVTTSGSHVASTDTLLRELAGASTEEPVTHEATTRFQHESATSMASTQVYSAPRSLAAGKQAAGKPMESTSVLVAPWLGTAENKAVPRETKPQVPRPGRPRLAYHDSQGTPPTKTGTQPTKTESVVTGSSVSHAVSFDLPAHTETVATPPELPPTARIDRARRAPTVAIDVTRARLLRRLRRLMPRGRTELVVAVVTLVLVLAGVFALVGALLLVS